MPPKRNTLHLHRANGVTPCGRRRGVFTPNVVHVPAFVLGLNDPATAVCTVCRLYYFRHIHRP
jgi:hypothetical protein